MKNQQPSGLRFAVAMACICACGAARAQQPVLREEKIEVTGSNIKRTDVEGPAPVTVIDRQGIERHGGHTLQEVLTTLPIATGSFTEGYNFGNSFAPGTAGASIHNVGARSTLVLVNGRRFPAYGFAQDSNTTFVDLNSIPLGAIERIEVLRDGASAIYGSDAIAGVVNVILRHDFEGIEVEGAHGQSSRGDAREDRASFTGGTGRRGTMPWRATASLDFFRREPLFGRDRDFTSTVDFRRFGGLDTRSTFGYPGTWLTAQAPVPPERRLARHTPFPNCPIADVSPSGICLYDFGPERMTHARTERKSAFGSFSVDLGPALALYAHAAWSGNRSHGLLAPSPDSFTLPVGHNSNSFDFPVTIAYRFTDLGPRMLQIDARTRWVVLGAKGWLARDWEWDLAHAHGVNEAHEHGFNFVSVPVRNRLVADGVYNFLDRAGNAESLVARLRASPWRVGRSTLHSVEAKATGPVAQLQGGSLSAAVGIVGRSESLRDRRDELSQRGEIAGSGGTTVSADRSNTAAFAELAIPWTRSLELQAAARFEHYDDFGASTLPKVALAWRPSAEILVRASHNRGFRAPTLPELHMGQTILANTFVDATRCEAYSAALPSQDDRVAAACGAESRFSVTAGNPDLTSEKSAGTNVGLVWEPSPGFSLAIDGYDLKHRKRVQLPALSFVLQNEASFPGFIVRGPRDPNDVLVGAPGRIIGTNIGPAGPFGINLRWFNAETVRTRGIDLEARYRASLGSLGRLDLASFNSYMDRFRVSPAPGVPAVETAGTFGQPRYRGMHSAGWTRASWEASARWNVVGGQSFPFRTLNVVVGQWHTLDLQAAYTGVPGVRAVLGVRNALDEAPPFGLQDTFFSPVGRFLYARITVKRP